MTPPILSAQDVANSAMKGRHDAVAASAHWKTYSPVALPTRKHEISKRQATKVGNREVGWEGTSTRTGIVGCTVLWELPSLIWPW